MSRSCMDRRANKLQQGWRFSRLPTVRFKPTDYYRARFAWGYNKAIALGGNYKALLRNMRGNDSTTVPLLDVLFEFVVTIL
jgi:hypothetical protein